MLTIPAFLSVLALNSLALAKILYAGVNESGGEFTTTSLPGRFGVDYAFINKSTVDIFVDVEKINFFRVTFLMERMCPLTTGLGSTFNETYFSLYADAINYITLKKGAYALLDPHNYMRYNDPSGQPFTGSVIGNSSDPKAASTKQFQNFWQELARRFASNPNVVFGINNEPHDMPSTLIFANNQAAINGIRSSGAKQLILAPGNGFTGGHSWLNVNSSSDILRNLADPLHNTAIDVHEYLDEDFSGQHFECTQPGPSNLAAITAWLKKNKLKAVLSEFGGGSNDNCRQFITNLLNFLTANDEWIGWNYWAAGPLWGDNPPCCGPESGSIEPGGVNMEGQPNAYETIWKPTIRPQIPKTLKRSGISSLN